MTEPTHVYRVYRMDVTELRCKWQRLPHYHNLYDLRMVKVTKNPKKKRPFERQRRRPSAGPAADRFVFAGVAVLERQVSTMS